MTGRICRNCRKRKDKHQGGYFCPGLDTHFKAIPFTTAQLEAQVERQRLFRERHPGYEKKTYRKRKEKRNMLILTGQIQPINPIGRPSKTNPPELLERAYLIWKDHAGSNVDDLLKEAAIPKTRYYDISRYFS